MTIQTSGAISITDIVTEFGGSAPHSLGEYYANGTAGVGTNNDNVPSSGAISLQNFYGAMDAQAFAISTSQQQLNLKNYLDSNGWDGSTPVEVTLNQNVFIWSDSVSIAALTIPSSLNGLVTFINRGFVIGKGGQGGYRDNNAGIEDGGPALYNQATGVVWDNKPTAYLAGGGGGGAGAKNDTGGDDQGHGGGGAGGGAGGGQLSGRLGGAGGAINAEGQDGGFSSVGGTSPSGKGGGAGGGGGGTDGSDGAGGGGGGRSMSTPSPSNTGISSTHSGRFGGLGGDSSYDGGAGGHGSANAPDLSNAGANSGGAGGGGWGARGGNVTTSRGTNYGGLGGRAITGKNISITNSGSVLGGTGPTVKYLASASTVADGFPNGYFTLSSGTKIVVVSMSLAGVTSTTPNSFVSLAGTNMTLAARHRQGFTSGSSSLVGDTAIYYMESSAVGQVYITGNGGSGRARLCVYEISGYDSLTPTVTATADTGASPSNTLDITLNQTGNSTAIIAGYGHFGTNTITTTGGTLLPQLQSFRAMESATVHYSICDVQTGSGNTTYTTTSSNTVTTDYNRLGLFVKVGASWR